MREIERLQAKRNAGLKKKQEDEEREKERSRKLERALKAKRERLAMQHRRKDGDDGLVSFGAPPSKNSSPGVAGPRGQRHHGLKSSPQAPEIEELVIEALNARLQDNPKMALPTGFKRVEKKNMEYRPQTPYVVQFAGGAEPPGQEGSAQKLTDQIKDEPGMDLPEGYEKVVPSGHEAHRLVAEILDEIAFKSLRLHILEPRESKGTCVVAQRDSTVPLLAGGAAAAAMSARAKPTRAPLAARGKQTTASRAEVPGVRSPAEAKKGEKGLDGAQTEAKGESPKQKPLKKKKSAVEARKAGPIIPVVGEVQDKVTKFIGVWVRDMLQSHIKKVESGEAVKELERKKEAKKSMPAAAAVSSPPAGARTGKTGKATPEPSSKVKGKAKDPEEAKRQAKKQAAHAKKLKEDLARYKEEQAKAKREKEEEEKHKKKGEREAKEKTREQERKRREGQKQKIEEYKAKQAAEKAAAAEEAAEKAKEELARRKVEAKEAKKRNQQREEAKKLKKQQEEEEAAAAAAAEGDALLQKAKTLVATVEKAGLGGLDDAGEEPAEADSADVEGGASEADSPQEGDGASGAEENDS
jgi:hypothetical protein